MCSVRRVTPASADTSPSTTATGRVSSATTIWRLDSGRSSVSRSPGADRRRPSSPRRRSPSSAISGTPVSAIASVSASSTMFSLFSPLCRNRSRAIASTGVRELSGSIPTWREKTR